MERGQIVLEVFLVAAAIAVALMLAIALSTRKPPLEQVEVTRSAYALRRWWFWVLAACVALSFLLSLSNLPYPSAGQEARRRHFAVVAMQFSFQLPQEVPLDTPVVFDVTSKDVNHGFGIYDPRGALVAQVQAMPDYVNHLPLKFTVPGRYQVRCLEYCGIAHHLMQAGFDVR
jgi:cytochrome c oxidase subunit 2